LLRIAFDNILFKIAEAKAAKESGMHTIILDRPGNASLSDDEKKEFVIVKSFADIPFETIVSGVKRKIVETVEQVMA
jgi:hypothetical protein